MPKKDLILVGDEVVRLKSIIQEDNNLSYGEERKWNNFFNDADEVRFLVKKSVAIAKKQTEDYELDFNARGYARLGMMFASALQKLEDEKKGC